VLARDGGPDTVNCGPGTDRATVDPGGIDAVTGCESVVAGVAAGLPGLPPAGTPRPRAAGCARPSAAPSGSGSRPPAWRCGSRRAAGRSSRRRWPLGAPRRARARDQMWSSSGWSAPVRKREPARAEVEGKVRYPPVVMSSARLRAAA
jgi:hypothetical protein